ncbi:MULTISPECIES: glycosyltransferase family 1 protein [Burkholderia]|uniref:Glycosyltransferase involved in cell wall biosynthesis n=1 Tax=Burkholderia pyrrocinia TaxID=60550 RepID=A0A318HZ81_BURPY|nr:MULTISPECIES: glycosyltransferase family 1 protein [Burkholderia]PXX23818.1 glycosyltransferase involved in cell wall biosynthesis [Burkholderia pyrrocinia]SFW87878.1 Glycosyltransferase involved in cell wall bisynthesis [Burkholderia sp. NFACC33-1]SFY46077.1 Glycosyltransferase involved in cell wall bisynthesis [Burkholderia sp. NFPP32]
MTNATEWAGTAPCPLRLDVTRLVHRWVRDIRPTGVDRVGLAYVRRYGEQARAIVAIRGVPVTLTRGASYRLFRLLLGPNEGAGLKAPSLRALQRVLEGSSMRPDPLPWQGRETVLHTAHSGLEYSRYFRAASSAGTRTVVMVHDLIPITHPHYCRSASVRKHARRITTTLRFAAGIVTNSQATLRALTAFADENGLPMPPAAVARLGVDTEPLPVSSGRNIARPHFVMVGTIEPRKNHWFILHLWRELVARWGNAVPQLVIVGRQGWKCANELDMLKQCPELQEVVVYLPDCSDATMFAQLRSASALLFPSFVEGYGLPIAEALSMGVPVLASNLAVFREIAGDVPDYLDPLDGAGWLARIQAYAQPYSKDRERQMERMAGFRKPTWPEHFAALETFLERLA